MRISYKLLFALFLFPLFSIAQSNYKPGYAVTLKGDTLHGFIDYRGWDANPTTISFKTAIGDNKPRKLTMADISVFNVDGVTSYKKYICPISMDETNTSKLGTARDTSYKIDTVFLQILQKGKNVALYAYTDGLKTRFFIGEAPDYIPMELEYRIYDDTGLATHKEGNTVIESTYLKQLFALANKYNVLDDALERTLQSANYAEPDLLAIVSKINIISKSEYAKKYAGRGKLNFFISGALNITNTSSNSGSQYTLAGGGPYTSYMPAASFGINFNPVPSVGAVEFRVELSLAEAKFNSIYLFKDSPYVNVKTTFNQFSISLIPQIIYNIYNTDNFKFYLGIGISLNDVNYNNAAFESLVPSVSVAYIEQSNPFYFNKIDDTILLKAGMQFNKKYGIFINYLTSTPTTQGGYYQLSRTNEQIGLVYFLGK
jgi:hypothetical protein